MGAKEFVERIMPDGEYITATTVHIYKKDNR